MLAVATSDGAVDGCGRFAQLTFVGLLGVRDPLRGEAAQSIAALQQAGVQVVMVTGDGAETAGAIAREAGLLGRDGLQLTSADLAGMNDTVLAGLLPRLRVVSRALPGDKSRLVRIAQGLGRVVGMTGDGVNDAPALKRADVGFAMGSGTEVAKEAGDVVILDDNLRSVTRAVLYGRTIFRSIRKFIVFQLTVNMCALGVSIIAPLIGFDSPVTVLQMLWVNMVMDTLAGLAFAGEPPLEAYMQVAPVQREAPLIDREMRGQIAVMATCTAVLCLWFLLSPWVREFFRPYEGERTLLTAFFALFMYAGIFNSFSARTNAFQLFDHILGNKAFMVVMGCVFVVQTLLVYVGGGLFRTYGLRLSEWLLCVELAALVIPVDLIRKAVVGRRGRGGVLERAEL